MPEDWQNLMRTGFELFLTQQSRAVIVQAELIRQQGSRLMILFDPWGRYYTYWDGYNQFPLSQDALVLAVPTLEHSDDFALLAQQFHEQFEAALEQLLAKR